MRHWILSTLVAFVACPALGQTPEPNSKLLIQLENSFAIHANTFLNVSDDAYVSELDVSERSYQIALIGLVQLKGSGENLIESLLASKRGTVAGPALEEGFFSDPARPDNLEDLVLPSDDFDVLAKCQPNQCKFKLNLAGIEKAQSLDWKADQSRGEFTDYLRTQLAQYVQQYRQNGSAGLMVYDDKPETFSLSTGAEMIRDQMKLLQADEPDLFRYLSDYPDARPPGVADRFYWSLKDFGYRPTLSLDHVIVASELQTQGATAAFILVTIYADHYLAARYQAGVLLDGEKAVGVPGHFLLLVDRMLFDDSLGSIKRGLLGRGMKSDMGDRLGYIAERAN